MDGHDIGWARVRNTSLTIYHFQTIHNSNLTLRDHSFSLFWFIWQHWTASLPNKKDVLRELLFNYYLLLGNEKPTYQVQKDYQLMKYKKIKYCFHLFHIMFCFCFFFHYLSFFPFPHYINCDVAFLKNSHLFHIGTAAEKTLLSLFSKRYGTIHLLCPQGRGWGGEGSTN